MSSRRPIAAIALLASVSGCVVGPAPVNIPGAAWQAQQQDGTDSAPRCMPSPPAELAGLTFAPAAALGGNVALLAPGDRLRLHVAGDDDRLSGVYVVGTDGNLTLPGIGAVPAVGSSEPALKAALTRTLIASGQIRPLANAVDLRLIESGGATVSVAGAVFASGTVRVGERSPEERVGQREGSASGDANGGRTLTGALRAAGGVRPDADLAHVTLVRGARWTVADLSGALDGSAADDITLAAGDRVSVPSTGCLAPALVRPSAVTPPGIRVYMSNLSRSAGNNASAAITKDATNLPYGTRMLQALVAMNCVGGSALNARRRAVLISRNPINGRSIVVERQVERLVRGADRDQADPYLMPDDALACYDSRGMNLSDAIGMIAGIGNAATPAILLSRSAR